MGDSEEFIIPEQYQQYVFAALEVIKAGFIGTYRGIVAMLQWSVVLSIGFAAGLLLYLALGAAAGVLLRKQLKKLKLHVDVTPPREPPNKLGNSKTMESNIQKSTSGVPILSKSASAAAGAAGSPTQSPPAAVKEGSVSKQ